MTRIRKAIIPIGSYGANFLPIGKILSNEMLPIVDRPLIQYAIDEALEAGIEEFIFITGRNRSVVENYLDEIDLLADKKVIFLHQPSKQKYTHEHNIANSVLLSRNIIGNEPFALFLPEVVIQSQVACLSQLIKAQEDTKNNPLCALAVHEISKDQANQPRIISHDKNEHNRYKITKLFGRATKEKKQSNLAITGRYILPPEIFEIIAKQKTRVNSKLNILKAMQKLLSLMPVVAVKFNGTSFDCSTNAGFIAANLSFAIERSDIKKGLIDEFIRSRLRLRIDNLLDENAIIEMTRILKTGANR